MSNWASEIVGETKPYVKELAGPTTSIVDRATWIGNAGDISSLRIVYASCALRTGIVECVQASVFVMGDANKQNPSRSVTSWEHNIRIEGIGAELFNQTWMNLRWTRQEVLAGDEYLSTHVPFASYFEVVFLSNDERYIQTWRIYRDTIISCNATSVWVRIQMRWLTKLSEELNTNGDIGRMNRIKASTHSQSFTYNTSACCVCDISLHEHEYLVSFSLT